MIIVLDTNVLISSFLSPSGTPAEIVKLWRGEELDLAISPDLLGELREVLAYERVQKYVKKSPEQIEVLIKSLALIGVFVDPRFTLDVITEDPDDNRVLECAVASRASFIVSGDKHLLALNTYQGIKIFTPKGFLVVFEMMKERN